MGPRTNQTIGAVETSFSIIDHLQAKEACGLTELAESMDLPKSTVYKHLQTLVDQGYVRQTGSEYRLGFRFLEHGGIVRDRSRIYTYGRPKVESLASELEEMVILSIREGDFGVFLFRSNDRYNLKDSLPMGARFHLHRNAAGKAILAELDDECIRAHIDNTGLPPSTEMTITEPDELIEEIETIRERGYALNWGERSDSVSAVSAAITDERSNELGAISISVPTDSPVSEHLDGKYAEYVRQTASELSLQLKNT